MAGAEAVHPRRWLSFVAALCGAGALVASLITSAARADRDPLNLLAPDHHLLEADFVGRVRVLAIEEPTEEEEPTYGLRVTVLDTWYSRWGPAEELAFRVAPDGVLVSAQSEYVVLLTGGEYRTTPFTYRDHSIYAVARDGSVSCFDTLPLFGVTSEGFLCSPREMVSGDPIDVDEMHRQFDLRRDRAAGRHPDLDARAAEPLAERPTPGSEVRR